MPAIFVNGGDDPVDTADSAVEIVLVAVWHLGTMAMLVTGSGHPSSSS